MAGTHWRAVGKLLCKKYWLVVYHEFFRLFQLVLFLSLDSLIVLTYLLVLVFIGFLDLFVALHAIDIRLLW